MTKAMIAGALLAALACTGAAHAQTCTSSCTAQHSVCAQAGKDYATCMGAWRQCRTACLTPARASAAPVVKATPAVVRR